MKRTQLLTLFVLLLLLGAAAFFFLKRSTTSWQSGARGSAEKVVNLDINQVAHIRIQQPDGQVNLKKKGDTWVVPERADYPASFEMISTFLREVWELKPVQEIKVGQSQLGRLSLLEPGKGANSGTLVEFNDGSDKRLAALLFGKKYMRESGQQGRSFPAGRYLMSEEGAHQVSLVSDAFQQIDNKPERWLERDFIKIEKPASIAMAAPDPGMNWKLEHEAESKEWKLADLKPDEKTDAAKANQVASPITNLSSFVDVVTDPKPEVTGLDNPVVFTVTTEDGFTYVLKVGKKMGENYPMTVSVNANLPTTRSPGKDEKPEEKEKLEKEFQTKRETLEKKLAKEKKFEAWTYSVPKFGIEQAKKNRADLIAPKSTPTPSPTPTPAAAAPAKGKSPQVSPKP